MTESIIENKEIIRLKTSEIQTQMYIYGVPCFLQRLFVLFEVRHTKSISKYGDYIQKLATHLYNL